VAACGDEAADDISATGATVEVAESPPPSTVVAATTAAPATVASTAPATTEPPAGPLQVLVTNDDGIGAPGIQALVDGIASIDDVVVTVVAPAENQSGTSMNLTEPPPDGVPAETASGDPAIAVAGFPADAVRWALANADAEFDLVVSGSNTGQNIGEFSTISGTVGAARYGAQQGIPSVAVSQGLVTDGGDVVFDDSVATVVGWIDANRVAIATGDVTLTSINAATCPGGNRGVVEVPLATSFDGRDPFAVDCASTVADPVDDVDAVINGFTAITELAVAG
jgi:5'-nucleotidase